MGGGRTRGKAVGKYRQARQFWALQREGAKGRREMSIPPRLGPMRRPGWCPDGGRTVGMTLMVKKPTVSPAVPR